MPKKKKRVKKSLNTLHAVIQYVFINTISQEIQSNPRDLVIKYFIAIFGDDFTLVQVQKYKQLNEFCFSNKITREFVFKSIKDYKKDQSIMLKPIFDSDAQKLINWIASNPNENSELFIQLCNSLDSDLLPVTCKIESQGRYIYFYTPYENVIHCIGIVTPNRSIDIGGNIYNECTPKELMDSWNDPNNFSIPSIFSTDNHITMLRTMNLLNMDYINSYVQTIKRDHKIEEIIK